MPQAPRKRVDAVLAQQFLELSQINPDLSPELTGFNMGEIDFRVESLDTDRPPSRWIRLKPSLVPVPPSLRPAISGLGGSLRPAPSWKPQRLEEGESQRD
jgi:hypothetical protein